MLLNNFTKSLFVLITVYTIDLIAHLKVPMQTLRTSSQQLLLLLLLLLLRLL